MSAKGMDVVGNSKLALACTDRRGGVWPTHCCGQRWRNQHKLRCGFCATRLVANTDGNVGEMGEMGDAALARMNALPSGCKAVRAYNVSSGVQRDIGLRWLQQ